MVGSLLEAPALKPCLGCNIGIIEFPLWLSKISLNAVEVRAFGRFLAEELVDKRLEPTIHLSQCMVSKIM